MANREFLMLAKPFDEKMKSSLSPQDWLMSVKMDGMRAIWIPHTRGMMTDNVAWANRDRDNRNHMCTGLWSRYGKVIHCPDWFIANLPTTQCLDGELWIGRQTMQELMSIVKRLPGNMNDDGWRKVTFCVFDSPHVDQLFRDGHINNVNYKYTFRNCGHDSRYDIQKSLFGRYDTEYWHLKQKLDGYNVQVVVQTRLNSWDEMYTRLDEELGRGGEGLILRRASSYWEPVRSANLLKVKGEHDSEGAVVGWSPGVGKYEGMMGSLRISWNGKLFDLSGFTDEERTLTQIVNGEKWPIHFGPGERITFKYRELTNDGMPKEARYFRKRVD